MLDEASCPFCLDSLARRRGNNPVCGGIESMSFVLRSESAVLENCKSSIKKCSENMPFYASI